MNVTSATSLGGVEIRVLACLMEKQRTTPDTYPLSLNALRLACNQSTNRDPVVDYDDSTIRDALQRLERRGLARMASGAGSRASKYRHLLPERMPMDRAEQAVICVLALRGAQTPGELKQRCERMHGFADLAEVGDTLARLIERELVERLPRRPGQKEERYRQLLGDSEEIDEDEREGAAGRAPGAGASEAVVAPREHVGESLEPAPRAAALAADGVGLRELVARIERLEREVAELRRGRDAGNEGAP